MSLLVDIRKQLGQFRLDVSFETGGGVLGILGASGCGKSYTLKCIAGIARPDAGRIVLNGKTLFDSKEKICLPPQKREVGYLFQSYALFPHMTVEQNILCGLRREKDKAERAAVLAELYELLQLRGLEKLRPAQLSGGQAQRAALARILASRPKLLLLDEPFSALDSHLRGKLQMEMKELLSRLGGLVLLVTHSQDEAYHLCQSLAIMDEGKLLTLRGTKQLFADPGSRRASELTGCKNNAAAFKVDGHTVEVPAWGVRLTAAQPVRDGLTAVGVRAHYFDPQTQHNRFPVIFTGDMEEPFEWILQFRFPGQPPDSPSLWWRVPKDRLPNPWPEALGVAPVNVLLYYS